MVGIIQYVSKIHHELSHAAVWLGSARARSTKHHLDLAVRSIRHMLAVSSRGVQLVRQSGDVDVLKFYSDTDWAACPHTRRSITSVLAFLFGMPLSLHANKHKGVQLSSTAAETVGMSEAGKRIVPARRLMTDLGIALPPTPLCIDNAGAKAIAENQNTLSGLARHIAVRHLFIKELVRKRIVTLIWVPSRENLSDIGTKSLDSVAYGSIVALIYSYL